MRRSWIAAAAGVALLCLAPLAAVPADASPSVRPVPATERTVVRPVTSSGHAAPGYHVTTIKDSPTVDCSGGYSSVAAVDNNIHDCLPSAADAAACWRASQAHHVLCLDNARKDTLVKFRTSGRIAHATAPKDRGPLDLQLADGAYCSVRRGGAANHLQQHRSWAIFYYCTHGKAVWGPQRDPSFGIDRHHPVWTVEVASDTGKKHVHQVRVDRAYLVGTLG